MESEFMCLLSKTQRKKCFLDDLPPKSDLFKLSKKYPQKIQSNIKRSLIVVNSNIIPTI